MADKKDKSKPKRGVDVSGYMPPGPVPPYTPIEPVESCKPGPPCPPKPENPDGGKDSFMMILKKLVGQQVTVYVMGMGATSPVTTIPTGTAVVPGGGTVGITGLLHNVGMDYVTLHVMMGDSMRVVYIPMTAIAAVVPGEPLLQEMPVNLVTSPQTTI